ncbi:MAG: roadblock/LC7 domain-containing protein [Planctomycetaceae bacterium]|jgi:predicted regulator of Ras-like GTPase activity (Roadblock/LC7/MglB family)|nr:roadblock/LC7 domain-containing protein [Planctomycetaceae bacterium]
MGRDQALRDSRLVFYAQDVARLDGELDAFLELSNAKAALLVDKEGHLVTRRGEPLQTGSLESVAALIAGSFAATREMARLLGESQFTSLFHQGQRDSIQLQLIGERTLLGVLFDERTNLGLVRYYGAETSRNLTTIFDEITSRPEGSGAALPADFKADAKAALDNLF